MMVTFTKLLVIKMVAKVRSESSRNICIFLSVSVFPSSSSATSEGAKLKNAISEPLAKADIKSNIAAKTAAMTTPMDGECNATSPKASVMVDKSKILYLF